MADIPLPITHTVIQSAQWGIPITNAVNAHTAQLAGLAITPWIDITLANGYVNETNYNKAQYRMIGDVVWVRGAVTHGAAPLGAVFTLPTGFRPPVSLRHFGQAFKTGAGGLYAYRGNMTAGGAFSIDEWSPITSPQAMTFTVAISFSTIA